MIKLTLTIDGMSCGMCEAHICDTIRHNFDVKKVKASFQTGKAEIIAKNDIPDNLIRDAIGKTGYILMDVEREPYEKKGLFH